MTDFKILTLSCPETHKQDICKQCRPRSDATFRHLTIKSKCLYILNGVVDFLPQGDNLLHLIREYTICFKYWIFLYDKPMKKLNKQTCPKTHAKE